MTLNSYSNLPDFLANCQNFLDKEEVMNHLMTGIANRFDPVQPIPEGSYLFSIQDVEKNVVFACVQTPGREMIVNGTPEAIPTFFNYIKENQVAIKGFSAPKTLAEKLVKVWETDFKGETSIFMDNLIHRLGKVADIEYAKGDMRLAEEKDVETLIEWAVGFQKDAFEQEEGDWEAAKSSIVARMTRKELFVWEDEQIVSMASFARPTKRGVAVNYVYTPKVFRKKGYARSLVAKLSQKLLDNGFVFCTLFTDRHNPTSNKIYGEIGYKCLDGFQTYSLK